MARFRRKAARARRSFRGFARRATRRAGIGKSAQLFQLDAMAYGAVRGPVSSWISSVVPIPVIGNVGDELAMGLANWLVAKNTSGMIRDVAIKGLVVENAMFGAALGGMVMGGSTTGSSGSNW